jgi:uncharacterized protein
MNIRRLTLDVDKSIARPSILELTKAVEGSPGVEAVNVTVTEIDLETVGMDVTVEGTAIDYEALLKAIEQAGAVVNSTDQIVAGSRLIDYAPRQR